MVDDLNWYKSYIYTRIIYTMAGFDRRQALGAFLRAHRERLPPPTLPKGRRRTPGLRREEIASLCGVSLTWITWLEQGRDVAASVNALGRLAVALHLTSAERAYLFELAAKRDPLEAEVGIDDLPPSVRELPRFLTIPTYLLDHTWTARAWNDAAANLFVGWLDQDHDRNLLRFIFLSSQAKTLISDWYGRARRVVAEFRADFSHRINDPILQALVSNLRIESSVFASLWDEQAVLSREGGERSFRTARLHFYQTTLIISSHPNLRLVALAPVQA